jgi:hypothetical protein
MSHRTKEIRKASNCTMRRDEPAFAAGGLIYAVV